jgi:pimeloyl-ACP methyl ester carboxylesterase
VGILLRWSHPGRPQPFVDDQGRPLVGSISEKIHVTVNGVEQGMFIESRDQTNPVLLYLHGGPGMPTYFLTQRYPTGLEEYFTVCWWEQRGTGLSYRAGIHPQTMTVEQFIADTLEVTNYLRQRFGKDKIYLMGHSWGSFIGIQAAARAPELFHAYIGVAQITHQLASEKLAYDYMLRRYKESGDARMARKLAAAPVTLTGGTPAAYLAVRDAAMHRLGIGTTHDMDSVVSGIFLASLRCRAYTLREKVAIWRGRAFSRRFHLWDELVRTDLTEEVPALALPIYFCHGAYDYTVSYALAKAYFGQLQAPLKGFYTFECSAHSPFLEEPGRMQVIVREDILLGATRLADAADEVFEVPAGRG